MDSVFWFKAFELIVSLSILVFIHELGHFMWARFFKVGVEKFYLFFDAYNFAFLRWNKKGLHIFDLIHFPRLVNPSETEYGIGWIPLGGYCAIVGMIDETHDAEHADMDRPDAFVKQGKFAQFMIMVGGVLNNLLLAIAIYIGMSWYWGSDVVEMQNLPDPTYSEYAHQIGFCEGDVIESIDGKHINYNDLGNALLLGNEAVVLRDGQPVTIALPDTIGTFFLKNQSELLAFLQPRLPMVVQDINGFDSPAAAAGMVAGDSIIAVWSEADSVAVPTPYIEDVKSHLNANAGKTVSLVFVREGQQMQSDVMVRADSTIGIIIRTSMPAECFTHIDYSLVEAIPAGIERGWNTLYNYVRQFKLVFTREGAKSVGGFGTMGSIFPDEWVWKAFWSLTAFISVALAFMNILPIPALDGGHILILIIEAIIRRPLSDKVKDVLQYIGFGFIVLLMVMANLNDIIRFFF